MAQGRALKPTGQSAPHQPSITAPTAPSATVASAGGEQHSGSGQHQQSGGQIDTKMMLDQGQNNRLLRLSLNEDGWQNRLVRGLQNAMTAKDGQRITVLLEPRKLGRMTLQVNLSGNNTSVQITTATAEAAAILSDSEAKLHQAFDQNGLKLTQLQTATQQHGNQNQGQKHSDQRATGGNPKDTETDRVGHDENSSTINSENGNNSQVNILA